jgi:hypothetical protein
MTMKGNIATLDPGSPLHNFNQEISGVLQSRSLQQISDHLIEYRRKYYQDLFNFFPGTSSANRIQHLIDHWTAQPSDVPKIAGEWLNLMNGIRTGTNYQQALIDLINTRRSRWQHLANQLGMNMPDAFRAYRGVHIDPAHIGNITQEIIKALQNDLEAHIPVIQRSLGSWSLDLQAASRFATAHPFGVIYEDDIPFDLTLADKWLDDADFIYRFGREEEVVVLSDADNKPIPVMAKKIRFTRGSAVYSAIEVSRNAHLQTLFQ